jgi:hypothetical protein
MAQRDLAASLRRQHHGKPNSAYAEGGMVVAPGRREAGARIPPLKCVMRG